MLVTRALLSVFSFAYTEQLPGEEDVLLQKLREEARAVFLQRKSRELLDNEELQVCPSFAVRGVHFMACR